MRGAETRTAMAILLVMLSLAAIHSPIDMATAFGQTGNESGTSTIVQPLYLRLQFLGNETSVILTQALPRDFVSGLAERQNTMLALMLSRNARNFDIYWDLVGNLWLRVNFTVRKGDFISTLTWVHSELRRENLTLPSKISFPNGYPSGIQQYLAQGEKIPISDERISQIAGLIKTDDMLTTVYNTLNYTVQTQIYDAEKTRLSLTGGIAVANYLDFMRNPIETIEDGRSTCLERSLFVTSILRAAGVPARTTTNFWLKSWVQVWLPNIGWVDADCTPNVVFPQSYGTTIPLMVQNSSDAQFMFDWHPRTLMGIVNTTLTDPASLSLDQFGTLLAEPVEESVFNSTRETSSFPVGYSPDLVSLGVLRRYSIENAPYRVAMKVGNLWKYQDLPLYTDNDVSESGWSLSFYPTQRFGFLALENLSLHPVGGFVDLRIVAVVVVVAIAVPVYLFRNSIFRKGKVIEGRSE